LLSFAGCEATGDAGGTKTFAPEGVPFTFELPSDFALDESIDDANSRGNVIAAAGLSKTDLIAVRRIDRLPAGPQRHEVLGKDVVSELHAVEGFPGYALECQHGDEYSDDITSACRSALESVKRK
jgi:hypothetical protein